MKNTLLNFKLKIVAIMDAIVDAMGDAPSCHNDKASDDYTRAHLAASGLSIWHKP